MGGGGRRRRRNARKSISPFRRFIPTAGISYEWLPFSRVLRNRITFRLENQTRVNMFLSCPKGFKRGRGASFIFSVWCRQQSAAQTVLCGAVCGLHRTPVSAVFIPESRSWRLTYAIRHFNTRRYGIENFSPLPFPSYLRYLFSPARTVPYRIVSYVVAIRVRVRNKMIITRRLLV